MKEFVFTIAKEKLMKGETNLATATIKCMLLQGSTPAVSITNLTGLTECNAVGYSRKTLSGISLVKDNPNNNVRLSASNVFWNTLITTVDITGRLYYIDVNGNDAAAIPLKYSERGLPKSVAGGRFEIQINNLLILQESKEIEAKGILGDETKTDAEIINDLKVLLGVV